MTDFTTFTTLFLDRDGIINFHRLGDYVKSWDEFEFLPGVLQALSILSQNFNPIIIVTNQRGIGKGLMSEQSLHEIHGLMLAKIENTGGRIDKIYHCDAIDDCHINRKPNIGMALQAKKDFPHIDFTKSIMVGDSDSDIKFAENAGMSLIFIGQTTHKCLAYKSLLEFAESICFNSKAQ